MKKIQITKKSAVVEQVGSWMMGTLQISAPWCKLGVNQTAGHIFLFQVLASPKKW